jgi:hypothetical protein
VRTPSLVDLVPFLAALVSLAILPSAAPALWEKRGFRALWAAVVVAPAVALAGARGAWKPLAHAAVEYVALVALLGTLFVISGGIALAVRAARPGAREPRSYWLVTLDDGEPSVPLPATWLFPKDTMFPPRTSSRPTSVLPNTLA